MPAPADTQTPDDLIAYVRRLVREGQMARAEFISQAERNDAMYTGRLTADDVVLPGHSYLLINKTGQAIIAHARIMLETRPRIILSARQTKTEPELWVTRKALKTVKSLIDRGVIESFDEEPPLDPAEEMGLLADEDGEGVGEPVPTESEGFEFSLLDDSDAAAFRVDAALVERLMPLTQPFPVAGADPADVENYHDPVLAPNDIITVDDTLTVSIYQNNLDIEWEQDDDDVWLTENVVNTKKFGMQPAMLVYDRELMRCRIFDVHIKNIYLPKNCSGIHGPNGAESVIVREWISREEAIERFPHARRQIEEHVADRHGASSPAAEDAPWQGVQFERTMVWVWHVWLRNHRYAMTVEDALAMGRVVKKDDKFLLTDDDYNVTDTVVEPDGKGWPKRRGIRQLQFVGTDMDVKVQDGECPYADIPVTLNKNIPLSYQPFGQGEPERLWFVQKMIDKLSSIIIDHLTYYRSPQQIFPISVYKHLKGINRLHSHPGRDTYLSDTVFERYREFFQSGKGFTIDTPKLTTSGYVELWQAALELHNDLSGHVGVLQGQAPGANSSGKVVGELQQAARGVIGFGSAMMEQMLRNVARLRLHAQRKWLPLHMWERMNDQYPVEVLAAARARGRNMEFDFTIEAASGGGQLRQQRKGEALTEVKMGVRSPQSYRRLAEIDDDPEWQPPVVGAAPGGAPTADTAA